ncbi:uncharacterized protein LOC117793972 [Drosophila innubila]|uniref:uncharacterized protein LOC117793972 n=1 Tax=Drosophila innubila TaxID=198719 RepID=UPI00148CD3C1|nr:uncharacterized protein LOC117793972 [Drosophila innubila]
MITSFSNFSTSTTFSSVDDGADDAQLPLILNGKYFKILKAVSDTIYQKAGHGVEAACQICPTQKNIRGSVKRTSNFLSHLKEMHRPEYEEFLVEKDQKSKRARKYGLRQADFDEKVLKFVVDTSSPLSIVDHPSFIALFNDNGCSFVKAFKDFGVEVNYDADEKDGEDLESNEDIPQSVEVPDISLTKKYRCPSHNLNLLATTDYLNIIKSDAIANEKHQSVMRRCSAVWNKCNRLKSAESIKNLLGVTLKTPCPTRWNSHYDAFMHLLKCKNQLDDLCMLLEVAKLSSSELQYLEEYCELMEPLATGLHFLQSDKSMFFGYFIPILITIKVKWQRMDAMGNFQFLNERVRDMVNALVRRFQDFFEVSPKCQDAFVAAISCPAIKLKFSSALSETAPDWTDEKFKEMFLKHAEKFSDPTSSTSSARNDPQVFNYFDYGETEEESIEATPACIELSRYLNDGDETIECLNRYPAIKSTFFKFNTPILSSALVERLFGYAGLVNGKRSQNFSDGHFEKLVLLKANNIF